MVSATADWVLSLRCREPSVGAAFLFFVVIPVPWYLILAKSHFGSLVSQLYSKRIAEDPKEVIIDEVVGV